MLSTTFRLTLAAESLAALAAHRRVVSEGVNVDPPVVALLTADAGELVGDAPIEPDEPAGQAIGMARALLAEALSLIGKQRSSQRWSTPKRWCSGCRQRG